MNAGDMQRLFDEARHTADIPTTEKAKEDLSSLNCPIRLFIAKGSLDPFILTRPLSIHVHFSLSLLEINCK